jgi:hypothetical protein
MTHYNACSVHHHITLFVTLVSKIRSGKSLPEPGGKDEIWFGK